MFLPNKLFSMELHRNGWWKIYVRYRSSLQKLEMNSLRLKFLENCNKADIIPRFLKFRVPNNGCFHDRTVRDFQLKLLRKEIVTAKSDVKHSMEKVTNNRKEIQHNISYKCLPSIVLHTRMFLRRVRSNQTNKLNDKLHRLSEEQERPLFNVHNTVMCYGLMKTPPKFVMDTLSLGSRNSIMEVFNQNEVLAELDGLLRFCRQHDVSDDVMTDINVKTLNYIKNCKKQKSPRNIQMTRRYLKENGLLAIPFDKGIGICLMKTETYNEKLCDITNLPQFQKVHQKRKNEKHPVMKEEERVTGTLKQLKDQNKITDSLFDKLKPTGSQPPRLYGLAKVHKTNVPLRPVLSMPGSAYYRIAKRVADWLSVVKECQTNSSSKSISESLKDIHLAEDEELISFDVSSLYTNVPVEEAINHCAELLYSGRYETPPISKDTFIELTTLCSCNVLLLTNDGYYRQSDGLAMGSPPAPNLANGWLSKFDTQIRDDATLYSRYMDDILRNIKTNEITEKLDEINSYHPNLRFTMERENENCIPFLDMKLINAGGKLTSTWYSKSTDTGLTMNFHALAPIKYKRSVVSGMVYRIHHACSTWKHFHESLRKAKILLENNQYPRSFYDPIIERTISKICQTTDNENEVQQEEEEPEKKLIFLQYRGKVTENFERSLKRLNAPCKIVTTIRKLRTVLPSLKAPVEKSLQSGLVYQITCSRCQSCYVGQTVRHLLTRVKEHMRAGTPVGNHFRSCDLLPTMDDVKIIAKSVRSIYHLMTLEALCIKAIKPAINTKDEFKSRTLVIKI